MLDNTQPMVYNQSENVDYEAIVGDLASTHIVKMDEQRAINDTECTHEILVEDPEDRIGKATYHGCANPKCGRGFYLQNKNIT